MFAETYSPLSHVAGTPSLPSAVFGREWKKYRLCIGGKSEGKTTNAHKTSNLYQAMAEEKEMCEALREVFAEELQESWDEGAMYCKIGQTIKKYKKGYSVSQTADMLEESLELIKQIYDAICKLGADSEVRDIYLMVKVQ